MIHRMKLNPAPFAKIEEGIKTIELRLYDEKRRLVKPGDFVEFTCTDNPLRKLCTVVTAIHRYDSFDTLYKSLPLLKCGYTEETLHSASAADMEAYYSKEEQERFGVVGIELRLTGLQKFLDAQEGVIPLARALQPPLKKYAAAIRYPTGCGMFFLSLQGLGIAV